MINYIGVKHVKAKPMTLGAYQILRGFGPVDEPSKPGYLVGYPDSPDANHPDYSYYISWSPADVFERAYMPITAKNLPAGYVQDVIADMHSYIKDLKAE